MFLELSAELRNKIYEEILLQRNYPRLSIVLKPRTGFEIPGILQACRQTRNEAAKMYFKQNVFVIRLVDCNADFLQKWMAVAVEHVGRSRKHHNSPACKFEYWSGTTIGQT